jgi:uncharacterized membrane protein YqjE
MPPADSGPRTSQSGLLASLPRLAATLLDILQTRIEIVSTEFEEERERLRELVVYGFWALFFTSLGIVLLTLFVVMALWEPYRLHALGAFAALYLLLGLIAALRLRRSLRERSRLFATTLAALRSDRTELGAQRE